jgi:hypothetical protein
VPCKGRLLCRLSHPGFASALRRLLLAGVANWTTRARREGLKSHPADSPMSVKAPKWTVSCVMAELKSGRAHERCNVSDTG